MAKSARQELARAMRESGLDQRTLRKVATRAVNKAAVSVRAEASKKVREELSLKAGDVKDAITLVKARQADNPVAKLIVPDKGIELYKFGAKPKRVTTQRGPRTGVTVKVKKDRKLVSGGFIATMKSGKTGVFKRTGSVTSKGKGRIRLLFSTTVADIFENEDFIREMQAYSIARLAVVLRQEMAFEVSKRGKGPTD